MICKLKRSKISWLRDFFHIFIRWEEVICMNNERRKVFLYRSEKIRKISNLIVILFMFQSSLTEFFPSTIFRIYVLNKYFRKILLISILKITRFSSFFSIFSYLSMKITWEWEMRSRKKYQKSVDFSRVFFPTQF